MKGLGIWVLEEKQHSRSFTTRRFNCDEGMRAYGSRSKKFSAIRFD
jgi:hypothetical protein